MLYSQIPKGGACHILGGSVRGVCTTGSTGFVRRQRERGKLWVGAFFMVSKGRNGRGRISRLKPG